GRPVSRPPPGGPRRGDRGPPLSHTNGPPPAEPAAKPWPRASPAASAADVESLATLRVVAAWANATYIPPATKRRTKRARLPPSTDPPFSRRRLTATQTRSANRVNPLKGRTCQRGKARTDQLLDANAAASLGRET